MPDRDLTVSQYVREQSVVGREICFSPEDSGVCNYGLISGVREKRTKYGDLVVIFYLAWLVQRKDGSKGFLRIRKTSVRIGATSVVCSEYAGRITIGSGEIRSLGNETITQDIRSKLKLPS